MEWIKASERKPQVNQLVFCKILKDSNGDGYCCALRYREENRWTRQFPNDTLNIMPDNIEWLDESPIPLSAFDKFKVSGPHLEDNPFYTLRKTDLEGIIGGK